MRARTFDYRKDTKFNFSENGLSTGFIAQELHPHYPEAVCVGDDDAELTNPKGTWQVDYGKLTPLLLSAIQELKQIVDAQASTIQSLTDRITKLENK